MNKSRINLLLDAIMLLGMMALVGTGYVRKYILLSGSAAKAAFGGKVDMLLLGIDRDGWAVIHLYLGYFLLFLLFWHIYLHWQQVVAIYRKWIPNKNIRWTITTVFILLSLVLLLFPFFIQPVIL
ncbi:MAG TPA: DUF4405 domain-containing protein [Syntrophomonas sp.]|nr:DUF4405 domain-containing protein [Syntrophomonas sp.]HRW11782.1 DUF4405 domain-containing protein [Syntrophomonas sp.]